MARTPSITPFGRLVWAFMGAALERKVTRREVRAVLDAYRQAVKTSVRADGRLTIPGLGTFRRTTRIARTIRPPPGAWKPRRRVPGGGRVLWLHLPETHSVRFSPCGEWRRSLK